MTDDNDSDDNRVDAMHAITDAEVTAVSPLDGQPKTAAMPTLGILKSNSVNNPAHAFLSSVIPTTAVELVKHYADDILRQAGTWAVPVDVRLVRRYLNLPVVRRALPSSQRGFTTADLRIYLNAQDLAAVQKFTFGHEVMEVLFFALKHNDYSWIEDALFEELMRWKEALCELGAAELIMPLEPFSQLVSQRAFSLPWASEVARKCGVSLTATLWRMIETGLEQSVAILWYFGHRPKEYVPSHVGQGVLFGDPEDADPPKKPRILRAFIPPDFAGYFPRDKSAPLNSSIAEVWRTGVPSAAWERLELRGIEGTFFVESQAFLRGGERHVLSLIHL